MAFLFYIKYYLVWFLRFIFFVLLSSKECLICDKPSFFIPLCNECKDKYFYNYIKKSCSLCGKEIVSETLCCLECREKKQSIYVDNFYSLFSYRLWNVRIMFMWKKQGLRVFSDFFAKILYKKIIELKKIKGDFFIVPIPPRKNKLKTVGWDQIKDITDLLKYIYKQKVINLLKRTSSLEQKKLSREERFKYINDSYKIAYKKNVPKKVCLIDDVKTTGATLEKCAQLLKGIGVKEVFALTIYEVS